MNKGKKIISTLAIASMLAGNVVPLASLAATSTMDSGIYTQADGTKYVGFRIHKSARTQALTVKDVEDKLGTTVTNYSDKTTVVGTGTSVETANGSKYTVVLYGDVNGDGRVTAGDASKIALHATHKETLTGAKLEAATVGVQGNSSYAYNSSVTSQDASTISAYATNRLNYVIDPMPTSDPEQNVPGEYEFTVNGNNVINDANNKTSKVNITSPKGRVEEETTFDLYYVDSNGKDVKITTSGLKIAQYADESGEVTVDFSSYIATFAEEGKESKVTLKLKTTDPDEVVGTVTVTVNRIHPEAVKYSARRDGTQEAGLKFEAKSGSDIVKVYYTVEKANSSESSSEDFIKESASVKAKSIAVENNKFDNLLNWSALENNQKYVVNFVVENAVGNISSEIYHAIVPNDSSAKQESKVTNVQVPNDLKPTWTAPTEVPTAGYKIIVYNEAGEVIGEIDASSSGEGDLTEVVKEAGKYKITVVSKGTDEGTTIASDETEPVEFEVTQLKEVTGIKFVIDEEDPNKVTLNWNEYADKTNASFDSYTISIYEYDPATGEYKGSPKTQNDVDKNLTEIEISKINSFSATSNTRYKAEIIANATASQGKVLSSKPVETTKDYFKLDVTMSATPKTDTEVELDLTKAVKDKIESLGNEVTYDVEIWSEVESSTAEKHYELADTRKNVTVEENGKIVVDKLTPGTNYKFVLIVHVDVDEAEGRSALSDAKTTLKTLPSLNGLVVVKKADKKEDTIGKVYTDGSTKLWINGEEVLNNDIAKYYDPNKLLVSSYAENLVNSLNDGDTIVSITDEKVTIKATNVATNGTPREIKAGSTRVLEIEGNKNEQELKITDAKEVVLTGNGALFSIDSENTAAVKLSNGVKLVSSTKEVEITVLANAKATINEVDVSSSGDLEVSETLNEKHELKIKSAKNNTIDITNHSGKALEVTFMNKATIGDFQVGKITINSDAGVTIKANEESTVEADISVTTENGDIDITDDKLTGAKNVTITTSKDKESVTVIKANTKLKAPIDMSTTQVEIMNYTVDQLKNLKENNETIAGSSLTQSMLSKCSKDEDYQAIVDYFNAFGSKLQAFGKAKVKASKDAYAVEITIPAKSEVTLAEIEGLK